MTNAQSVDNIAKTLIVKSGTIRPTAIQEAAGTLAMEEGIPIEKAIKTIERALARMGCEYIGKGYFDAEQARAQMLKEFLEQYAMMEIYFADELNSWKEEPPCTD